MSGATRSRRCTDLPMGGLAWAGVTCQAFRVCRRVTLSLAEFSAAFGPEEGSEVSRHTANPLNRQSRPRSTDKRAPPRSL